MPITRRRFIGSTTVTAALIATGAGRAFATPLGLPLGLQLYSVRDPLQKDYAGTLKQVSALGYQEVEAAGFYKHPIEEVKAAMTAAGLRCPSAHYPLSTLKPQLDVILPFCKSLGVEYIVCAAPMHRQESGGKEAMSMDDWRWNADEFNQIGEKVAQAGMHFAYHNHVAEFTAIDGALPYDELIKHTDAAKVSFELDCGWAVVAGQNPAHYLQQYTDRIVMLHVKDFKENKPPSVELGTGSLDYGPIFAAAKSTHIHHCFVEQEEFQGPIMEALAVDARYMKGIAS